MPRKKKLSYPKAINAVSALRGLLDGTEHDARLDPKLREEIARLADSCDGLARVLWADERAGIPGQ